MRAHLTIALLAPVLSVLGLTAGRAAADPVVHVQSNGNWRNRETMVAFPTASQLPNADWPSFAGWTCPAVLESDFDEYGDPIPNDPNDPNPPPFPACAAGSNGSCELPTPGWCCSCQVVTFCNLDASGLGSAVLAFDVSSDDTGAPEGWLFYSSSTSTRAVTNNTVTQFSGVANGLEVDPAGYSIQVTGDVVLADPTWAPGVSFIGQLQADVRVQTDAGAPRGWVFQILTHPTYSWMADDEPNMIWDQYDGVFPFCTRFRAELKGGQAPH